MPFFFRNDDDSEDADKISEIGLPLMGKGCFVEREGRFWTHLNITIYIYAIICGLRHSDKMNQFVQAYTYIRPWKWNMDEVE